VPASLVEETIQRLDQFLFGEDVQLSDLRAALTVPARMSAAAGP
jgi:hypothetical protein